MAEQSGNAATLAIALNNRSLVLQRLSRYDEAHRDVLAAREVNDANGSLGITADILDTLGALLVRTGDLEAAEEQLQAALTIHRDPDVHNRAAAGLTLHHLGELRSAQDRPEEALQLYQEARTIAEEVGEPDLATMARLAAGQALCALDRWAEATEEYAAAHTLASQTGNRRDEAAALTGSGRIAAHNGDETTARQCREQALGILREIREGPAGA